MQRSGEENILDRERALRAKETEARTDSHVAEAEWVKRGGKGVEVELVGKAKWHRALQTKLRNGNLPQRSAKGNVLANMINDGSREERSENLFKPGEARTWEVSEEPKKDADLPCVWFQDTDEPMLLVMGEVF